ncbi:MAG: serine/threonine-protein kinase, partial [Myxococcota bacterium]|nr:serine/threonine-protein kinase [Myxococcota bacterium]
MSGTPGDRIGPYVLEELLGAGGMGSVWASRDLSTNTRVALKIIRGCEHPEALVASMRAWSRLDHPNIVRTLDCGEDGDVVWVAMELLSGLTLRQHLREEPLSHWTKGLSWVADIADALTHLHARGILHRDLKPSNIILVNGRAVLVDFGLAARVDMEDADTPAPAGTLGYMAPEVLLDGWRLDARADLYSLGCILYELLSGWRAAHAKTPR